MKLRLTLMLTALSLATSAYIYAGDSPKNESHIAASSSTPSSSTMNQSHTKLDQETQARETYTEITSMLEESIKGATSLLPAFKEDLKNAVENRNSLSTYPTINESDKDDAFVIFDKQVVDAQNELNKYNDQLKHNPDLPERNLSSYLPEELRRWYLSLGHKNFESIDDASQLTTFKREIALKYAWPIAVKRHKDKKEQLDQDIINARKNLHDLTNKINKANNILIKIKSLPGGKLYQENLSTLLKDA